MADMTEQNDSDSWGAVEGRHRIGLANTRNGTSDTSVHHGMTGTIGFPPLEIRGWTSCREFGSMLGLGGTTVDVATACVQALSVLLSNLAVATRDAARCVSVVAE